MILWAFLLALMGVALVMALVMYRLWWDPWGVSAVVGLLCYAAPLVLFTWPNVSFNLMESLFCLILATPCFFVALGTLVVVHKHGTLRPEGPDRLAS